MPVILLFIFGLLSTGLVGQEDIIFLAKKHLNDQQVDSNFTEEDLQNLRVSDIYYSIPSKAHFVYFQQVVHDIDVYNAVSAVVVRDDFETLSSGHRLIPNAIEKIANSEQNVNSRKALKETLKHLNIPEPKKKIEFHSKEKNLLSFHSPQTANGDILAEKVYLFTQNSLYLCWRIEIDSKFEANIWSVFVDAKSGNILQKYNHTLKCLPNTHAHFDRESNSSGLNEIISKNLNTSSTISGSDGEAYRVYPYWIESPNHGQRELLIEPADALASPFGWHDLNGEEGAETTITMGNNAHAFQDTDDDDESSNDEPNGGKNLQFDFPHEQDKDVLENIEADVTQIFYMTNVMHDWSYHLGFDEGSGNFQNNNYGRGGEKSEENDAVDVNALDGVDIGQIGNANFSLTADGRPGRMQLFKFEARGLDLIVLSPLEISTTLLTGTSTFGPGRVSTELEGKVVLVNDEIGDATDACETIVNGNQIDGNIALIRRGTCFFSSKVFSAQELGAKAVIICNNVPDQIINMNGADNASRITIPSYFIGKEDCQPIEQTLLQGDEVRVKFIPNASREFSAGFDNGIVAHEYGHGISSRLTGGPSSASCLNNDEQMGEGWSDFIALVITKQPHHTGREGRGIGTYVEGESPNGSGFRRMKYSTDFTINNQTMNDIRGTGSSPHQLGEVWASALWDMYWLFVEEYGYDDTWTDEVSGNYQAMRLVFDAMKIQPCNPGFIEGRDALLKADRLLYDSKNLCLIWQAFARRGIGINAFGGANFSRDDNREGYEALPTCIKELKIKRIVAEIASSGDIIDVNVIVPNHTGLLQENVMVTDEIPENASFVEGSSNYPINKSNNNLMFNIGTIPDLEEVEVTYQLQIQGDEESISQTLDNFSMNADFFENLNATGKENEWRSTSTFSQFGSNSYNIIDDTTSVQGDLTMVDPIKLNGDRPIFTFWHRYNTEYAFDGGLIEISIDNGSTWSYVPTELFILNGYDDEMINNLFGLPTKPRAFTGDSEDWIQSFVDLSSFKDNEILLRFRWASDQRVGVSGLISGWFIDYVEFLDLSEMVGTSCVSSSTEPQVCTTTKTLLRSRETVSSTNDLVQSQFKIQVFPNPTNSHVNVTLVLEERDQVNFAVYDVAGRSIYTNQYNLSLGEHELIYDSSSIPDGVYFLRLVLGGKIYNHKLIKQQHN